MIAKEITISDYYNSSNILYSKLEDFLTLNHLHERLIELKHKFPCNRVIAH